MLAFHDGAAARERDACVRVDVIFVTVLVRDVARARGGNLGAYERKIETKLDPYVLMLSAGYSF